MPLFFLSRYLSICVFSHVEFANANGHEIKNTLSIIVQQLKNCKRETWPVDRILDYEGFDESFFLQVCYEKVYLKFLPNKQVSCSQHLKLLPYYKKWFSIAC